MNTITEKFKSAFDIFKNPKLCFSFFSLPFSFLVFLIGSLIGNFNTMLSGVLLLFLSNVIFGFFDCKKRFIFLFFHLSFFTFLIARPFISFLKGDVWWYFSREATVFALNALFISLLLMRVGSVFSDVFIARHQSRERKMRAAFTRAHPFEDDSAFIKAFRFASFTLFIISLVFFLAIQIEKLIYMNDRDYADIYLNFKSRLPGVVYAMSTLMPFALRLYLATFPKKRIAFCTLAVYVLSAVPDLIIGARNNIVLNILFAVIYYIIRDVLRSPGEKRWFGKLEITLMIIAIPIAFVGLGAYNYLRDGQDVSMNLFELFVDFFYRQGCSFDVLCRAYEALPLIVSKVYRNFTFGPIIDYLTRSGAGLYIFNSADLGYQNGEALAWFGNYFAHSMSYIAHPEYLEGHGWGSSFILEFFADWGYSGIIVGSFLFGCALEFLVYGTKKGIFTRTVVFCCISNLLLSPRAEATSWLSFIVTPSFWLPVIFCFGWAFLFKKRYFFNKERIVTMFDQCGFMDVLYALFKKKYLIIACTVIFGLFGFAGAVLFSGNSDNGLNNLVNEHSYEQSACYEIIDVNDDKNDISQQYAYTVLSLAKADFSVSEIFQSLTEKYSNEDIVHYLEINKSADDLMPKDIENFLKGSVLSSTSTVNIYISTGNEQFSKDFFDAYKASLEKYASQIKGCECRYINGNTAIDSPLKNEDYGLSFSKLGIIGLIFGFVISCAYVALKAFFVPTLNRGSDFEMLDIPVLSEIDSKGGVK